MEYVEIRRKMIDINTKIFKQEMNDTEYLTKGARLLGLRTEDKNIFFEDESEQNAYWDFLTYENFTSMNSLFTNIKGSNVINSDERIFLENITVYDSGLYWLGSKSENEIDITNVSSGDVFKLYDINLSKINLKGSLIFLRLLNIEEYYMTSGFSFIFVENIPVVLKREKILMKTDYSVNKSITRFKIMMKLNRIYGNIVRHKDV